jgi:hypothetical protein
MKNLVWVISLFISANLFGQYYYNDIVSTTELNNKMKAFVAAKVQSVTATGYDAQGIKSADFNEWQDVQNNGSVLKVTTRNGQNVTRIYYSFDEKARLIGTRDSSRDIEIITDYKYDENGNLVLLKSTVQDAQQDFNETEERQWLYSSAGKPEKMWRIVNSKDSSEYRFSSDENGNIGDEQLFRRGIGISPVYYYYDEKHRLTDIVRYNKTAKQLLPDVMFEYDNNDRVIQRITTLSTKTPDYLTWRYLYNDKALKTKEAMFSKTKQLKGRIDYAYTYKP